MQSMTYVKITTTKMTMPTLTSATSVGNLDDYLITFVKMINLYRVI